ncbi:MAG: glycerol-3-phosphate O-acyltransferase / dihydroxyacetone phosphate acyltransferase [Acidobacteriota bacterium]|jgi:1-acyl-sn-glycerol-3-phosphate acyltransferase|nr:glycerol-3-phosphate O-acyltransferase / dihydroxyacetone phosphate acyltransferase [Acidobacteriota bacterium]
MRRLVTALCAIVLRVFFRRIEIAGQENIPVSGGVIFAVNHPNGLVDPLFLLCYAPRPVSFLAKAPLFRYPLIGWLVRQLETIPVYRKQDNVAGSNEETFSRARAIVVKSGSIAIFPEGTTHSDSKLRELKTGAARIALGCGCPLKIVPTGIYYTAKQTFRSSALMYFGAPIDVEATALAARASNGEPDPIAVEQLTDEIERALNDVTLQADTNAALELIARAEKVFTGGATTLADEFELRRRFVAGYSYLRERDPLRLERLAAEVAQIDAEVVEAQQHRLSSLWLLILLPIALVGAIIQWPTYRLIGVLANRFSRGEDEVIATIKCIGALVFYPLMWLAIATLVATRAGVVAGLLTLIILPLLGYIALRVFELLDDIIGRVRATMRRDVAARQRALRADIIAVADEMAAPAIATAPSR